MAAAANKTLLAPSGRAPGLLVAPDVEIADDAEIGGHVILHAGVRIGAGCLVQDNAVLGKRPIDVPNSRSARRGDVVTSVAAGAVVGTAAVLFAGVTVAEGAIVGDQALLREGVRIGPGAIIGSNARIGFDVPVGARARVRSNAVVAPASVIEDDVFVGAAVIVTDHNAMGRDPERRVPIRGAVLRRGCRVGSGAVLLPGVEIGVEAVVGAGAVVTRDVPASERVLGPAARPAGDAT